MDNVGWSNIGYKGVIYQNLKMLAENWDNSIKRHQLQDWLNDQSFFKPGIGYLCSPGYPVGNVGTTPEYRSTIGQN
jgi:hypothetical protein